MSAGCGTPGCAGDHDGDWRRQVLEGIEQHIAEYGVSIMGVGGGPSTPSFCYTIGRAAKGLPEVIMLAVPREYGHVLLNALHAMEQKGELQLTPGTTIPVIPGLTLYPLRVGSVAPANVHNEYLVQASRRQQRVGGPAATAVQLIMCDRQGRYPLDANYDSDYMRGQLCLAPAARWDYEPGAVGAPAGVQ